MNFQRGLKCIQSW